MGVEANATPNEKDTKMQTNQTTTTREWHDLKAGDQVFFATGFYEVFDAYPIGRNTVLVKIKIRGHKAPTLIETHRVRVNGRATVLA